MTQNVAEKIKAGVRARLRKGAEVLSKNPRRENVLVTRPYWVDIERVVDGVAYWQGSANYYCHAALDAFDDVID